MSDEKKHVLKSKTNIVQIVTILSAIGAMVFNDSTKELVCKTLCDSPKSAAIGVIGLAVINLLARNVKSNTAIKVKK